MEESYRLGWLVFEREGGDERRRLSGIPDGWTSLSPERLAQLCGAATPVVSGRSTPTGQMVAWSRSESDSRPDR